MIQDLAAQGERGAGGGAGSAGGEPSGSGLPEFVEIDAPGVKLSRALSWDGQCDTCKPPGPRAGHGALGIGNLPACGILAVPVLENGCKGYVEHAQDTSNLKQGSRGVGEHCKASAMAELRRRDAGVLGPGT